MPRNLDRRVEVMFPVEAPALREQIRREVIEPALADNACAYDMHADGSYARRTPAPDAEPRAAQVIVLERTVGWHADATRPAPLAAAAAATTAPPAPAPNPPPAAQRAASEPRQGPARA